MELYISRDFKTRNANITSSDLRYFLDSASKRIFVKKTEPILHQSCKPCQLYIINKQNLSIGHKDLKSIDSHLDKKEKINEMLILTK